MHFVPEYRCRNRAADDRGGDIVEERRQHENHGEQHESALPVVGQEFRQHCRHMAFLEVPRQQRKADEQEEEVAQNDPLVRQVGGETIEPGSRAEAGK